MKTSLSKISFFNLFFTLIIFSAILATFIYQYSETLYEERVTELERNYLEKNKTLTKNEVKRAIARIDALREVTYKKNESILKEKVKLVKKLFDNDLNIKDTKQLINKYKKELDLLKWDNGTGYFYIFNTKGKILYHGTDKTLEQKDIFTGLENNKDLYDFLKRTVVLDENFGVYKWYMPNDQKKELHTKYVYIKKDEKHDIFIAAGVYKNMIEESSQEIVYRELRKDRYGESQYGYFWVIGLDFIMKMHGTNPKFEGLDQTKLLIKDPKGNIILDGKILMNDMKKSALAGGGHFTYNMYRPDTSKVDTKISYAQYYKNWDVVIGTGFYITELQKLLKNEKEYLKKVTDEYLVKVFTILSTLIIIALIIARYISLKIQKVELEREDKIHMLDQYKMLLDESSVVSKTDPDGTITYVNNSFENTSGYHKNEIIGEKHSLVHHPDTPKSVFNKLWRTISEGDIWKGIIKNKNKNGESFYSSTTIVPIKSPSGEILEYISSGTDVTELIENRTKLQSLFKTDALTGLGNRVSLIDEISKDGKGVLTLFNIDRFKEINDSFSHDVGDDVIRELGDRLFEFFNDKEYKIYRVQADIFAIYSNTALLDNTLRFIKVFIATLGEQPYEIKDNKFMLTYTCGVSSNSDNLLTYADIALNEAKNKKEKIKSYDESMANIEEFRKNIEWVERLHIAIKEDRIVPYYQAIYNYHTKKIEKYEALMRLEEGGKIHSPFEYLEIAKKTKLYPELTYKMVEKVISEFADNSYEFSINLSIEDLMNEELMIFIYDYAKQKGVFDRMVLEIVESEEIEDSDHISKLITKFKDMGAKIAIDDFGSGYSNYEYLISLQADFVKIDGSIIKHILDDERTRDVVRSIVSFAKKSDMKVIAEFVSSKEISELLEEMDVDFAQGFYHGKPDAELL